MSTDSAYTARGYRWCRVGCLLASSPSKTVVYLRDASIGFCACCQSEIEGEDQAFCLTQSQYADTWPTSHTTDPVMTGARQGSTWNTNFEVTGMTALGKRPIAKVEMKPRSAVLDSALGL